jgi:hypothetical protein
MFLDWIKGTFVWSRIVINYYEISRSFIIMVIIIKIIRNWETKNLRVGDWK